jgi:hypothetical protein
MLASDFWRSIVGAEDFARAIITEYSCRDS